MIGDRVADEYLGKLLDHDETGLALEALQIRLTSNPNFYPQRAAYAARLTEVVTLSGRKTLSRQLIANAPVQRTEAQTKA
ncbi:MAG: hypothetical protein WDM77_19795 [Steroidobacteraceae bacterium]